MSDQPFERLAYQNRFVKHLIQQTEGTDCFVPFVNLNEAENLVVLKLSAAKINRMFSALITGADITYPDESMQIMVDFLSGIHCPPVMEAQDCYEYPTYGSFISYTPNNPYLTPGEIPEGYAATPFLVNGQDGVSVPNYDEFDILVPVDALTLDVNWFEDIAGQLPTIQILVQGAGKVFLKMLTYPGGGLAVVTVDNPPNLLDILAGIVTGAENIMDLNQDIISLPPETAQEIIFETDTVGTGLHTIYVVFLPILDDSLIPLRFGGGFRGVQLCDFVEQPLMGIQDIRFNDATCNLETLVDGEWTVVTGWENWLDCVPSGGGGGAGAAITVVTGTMGTAGTGSTTTTSTSFVDISGYNFPHTPTRSNMLVICENIMLVNSSTNQPITVRIVRGGGGAGLDANEAVAHNLTSLPLSVSERFAVTPGVAATIELQWKVTAGTATCSNRQTVNVTILEYDNAEDLFVEDIRIVDGELQKKIGGAWIPVTESLAALLDTIAAAASAAQTTANTATSTNTTQQTQINSIITVNNTQNTRLTNLEAFQSDAELSFLGIQAQLDNHESRIDALEATALAITPLEFWYKEWSFLSSASGWTSPTAPWVSGQGFVYDSAFRLQLLSETLFDNRITHMKLNVRKYTGGFGTATIEWVNTPGFAVIRMSGGTLLNSVWTQVGNLDSQPNIPDFLISNFSGEIRVEGIKLLGRGSNIFP